MGDSEEAKILTLTPATLNDPDLSPQEWVDRYARLHNIRYHYKTNSVTEADDPIEAGLFISKMRLYCFQNDLGGIRRALPDAFLVWRREQSREYIRWLRRELKFLPSESDWIAEWVEAATGERRDLDVVVMRHWIWQVKRKLYALPVDHHLLVALFGASGAGKSVAVHRLITPLNEVTSFRDFRIFGDQFARRAFNRSYIMFFDELGRAEDADVNSLKDVISASTIDWRGIGSEVTHSAAQNSTFLGCTNLPVRERIRDSTSARRFWQLTCAPLLNWEKINSLDYMALWRSVDENAPCPIIACLGEVRAVQESTIRDRDYISEWLDYACEPKEFGPESPSTETLFMDFNAWCGWRRIFDSPGLQTFARGLQLRINGIGWSASSKHSNKGTVWSLKIKSPPPSDPVIKSIAGLGQETHSEAVSAPAETTNPQGEE